MDMVKIAYSYWRKRKKKLPQLLGPMTTTGWFENSSVKVAFNWVKSVSGLDQEDEILKKNTACNKTAKTP